MAQSQKLGSNPHLQSLKQQLKQIESLIVDKNDVFYFDYPLHLNVGDLLIYAGTEQFFKDYHINIRLRRSLPEFDIAEIRKHVRPSTTLLCHGGGNFGDIYPSIQKMREALVKAFPNNRIILLPQTAHFADQEAMLTAAQIFSAHTDLHLFARDQQTENLFKSHFSKNTQLMPDMAHQLYGVLPRKSSDVGGQDVKKTLYFLRKDVEKSHIESEIQATLTSLEHVKDWEDILQPNDFFLELWLNRIAIITNRLKLNFVKNWISQIWYKRSLEIIERCANIFMSYDEVVTSRLHGHIFSCLLELPNQVCDNSYGKNSGYYRQWTNPIEYTQLYSISPLANEK